MRERQLLEVAERCFAAHGYQGTSLEIVARESGVTRQYLSKLFGDKDGLYLACHSRARDQLNTMLVAVAADIPAAMGEEEARALLRAGAAAFFRFVRDHGAGWDVLFGTGSAVAGPAAMLVEQLRDETVGLIEAMLHAAVPGLPEEEVPLVAQSLSGAGTQVAKWWRRNPGVALEALVDRYAALFADGLVRFMPASRG